MRAGLQNKDAPTPGQARDYIPQIDSLRALAVLGVFFFHYSPEWLSGGYWGVDVFFVISGFVITKNIQTKLESNSFSLKEFFRRRVFRLFPALLTMLTVTTIVGTILLFPNERSELGLYTLGSIFPISNILYWKMTGGYWDTAANSIPTLHTWSLSVEEQFYIFYPLGLILIFRFLKQKLLLFLTISSLLSLALSIGITNFTSQSSAAFFLLPTRAWELGLGGLTFLAFRSRQSGAVWLAKRRINPTVWDLALKVSGLALITGSFFIISEDFQIPGAYALFPCIGTSLLLMSFRLTQISDGLFTIPFIRYIGKVSYAVYLWHWPIVVYSEYFLGKDSTLRFPCYLLLTAVFATGSYHFIEARARYSGRNFGYTVLFGAITLTIFTSILFSVRVPFVARESPLRRLAQPETRNNSAGYGLSFLPKTKRPIIHQQGKKFTVALIGNSNAYMYSNALMESSERLNYELIMVGTPTIGVTSRHNSYGQSVNQIRDQIIAEAKPDILIIAGLWTLEIGHNQSEQRFSTTLVNVLENHALHSDCIILLNQLPILDFKGRGHDMRPHLVERHFAGKTLTGTNWDISAKAIAAQSIVRQTVESKPNQNIQLIDLDILMAATGKMKLFHNDRFLYYDRGHLNLHGARLIVQRYVDPIILSRSQIENP